MSADDHTTPPAAAFTGEPDTDLLGRPLRLRDRELLHAYRILRDLASDPQSEPCAAANTRAALAHLAVAVTDLGLAYEHLVDLGV
ncbi:hypothetical protein [Streptomyces eurythermus]|uniref:hypothetical protein n=1 Tax=Streptomyces eurythermus TaxID=42237 RepID=UPI0036FB560B